MEGKFERLVKRMSAELQAVVILVCWILGIDDKEEVKDDRRSNGPGENGESGS